MKNKSDKELYEEVESKLRDSIPFIAQNVHSSLNESSNLMRKMGLFAAEYGHRIVDAAHRLNLSANMASKKNASRIRDELLTSHYSAELGMKKNHINTILNFYPQNHPDRISLEAKIRTVGRVNPIIGSLQKTSTATIGNYKDKINKSYSVLTTPRTPAQMANIYRYVRSRIP
jgi:hypothetical protein